VLRRLTALVLRDDPMLFVTSARVAAPACWGRLIALTCVLLASACATAPAIDAGLHRFPVPASGSTAGQKIGRPYQVGGVWYVPAREDNYDEVGVASWYGPGFHGRSTANGEIFDENLISAAHTTLPLPSLVRVRNLENGREITARLNDRGPFADDRIIDMSRAAARELGFERQGTARVRVRYLGPADSGSARLLQATAPTTTERAFRAEEPGLWTPVAPGGRGGNAELYVQVASFRDRDRAVNLMRQLGEGGPVFVTRVRIDGRTWHRVMIGPWRNSQGADEARQAVARMGFADARIVNGD
jgi:rare lipoprotein A